MSLSLSTAQALRLWHDVGLNQVKDDEPDLSVRQMTILLSIYLEVPPHTVRALAGKLEVSKPVITRALDAMANWVWSQDGAMRPTGATCSSNAL